MNFLSSFDSKFLNLFQLILFSHIKQPEVSNRDNLEKSHKRIKNKNKQIKEKWQIELHEGFVNLVHADNIRCVLEFLTIDRCHLHSKHQSQLNEALISWLDRCQEAPPIQYASVLTKTDQAKWDLSQIWCVKQLFYLQNMAHAFTCLGFGKYWFRMRKEIYSLLAT